MHHMDESDIFSMLGGGGGSFSGMGGSSFLSQVLGGGGGRRRPRKGEPTVQPLNVTLEELYKGKTSKLQLTKKVLCAACNGLGGKAGAVRNCEKCRGSGKMLVTRQMGPGMITQMATHCDGCAGQGEIINEKDKCKKCNARKTVHEQKIIEVKVTPGMRDGQKIVFYGEGDQEPDIEPGDVVLVLRTKPHETFQRKGDDLFMRKKISLNDSLCGYSGVIQHLDGRHLLMSSIPCEVIPPESVRGILGEGMPKPDSTERGNLYVIFDVEFPENHFFPEPKIKKLESLLPPRPIVKVPAGEDVEEVSLAEFDPRRHDFQGGSSREAYHADEDSDSDETGGQGMPHGQHVQCAQQ